VFRAGEAYATVLVLDRAETDRQVRRAFWLRLWAVAAGAAVLVLLSVAWLTTVRLVESRSQARLLQSEADHLHDMGQAAAGLAHETRNPLGLVRGWTQRLAQSPGSTAEQRRQAQAVIEECDRITVRINQFLSYAKPCDPQPERLDLEGLVAELVAILQPDLECKALKIDLAVENRPAVVDVDREMFRQAVFNLLSNAIEFAPQSGVIEVRLTRGRGGRLRLEIADPGPGVPAERADSLFSPYFSTRPGGVGLGLAIVRRIARAHGWRAGYRPRPGGGSIFWLDHADDR
jgi:signal transduction histidine kinase